ncbi:MAG TPA: hypothetical protein EYG51_22250 [Pseudomonadales bacterium]|nr:hypothetical protein [Pseudomonadales bacterium]
MKVGALVQMNCPELIDTSLMDPRGLGIVAEEAPYPQWSGRLWLVWWSESRKFTWEKIEELGVIS